jgi:hypothetical protein
MKPPDERNAFADRTMIAEAAVNGYGEFARAGRAKATTASHTGERGNLGP